MGTSCRLAPSLTRELNSAPAPASILNNDSFKAFRRGVYGRGGEYTAADFSAASGKDLYLKAPGTDRGGACFVKIERTTNKYYR